jgi:FPC/CPF motif-containing protein YcgG
VETNVHSHISSLVGQKFYPCVAAVQSVAKKDYVVFEARSFGEGVDREGIRKAICDYLRTWMKTRSTTYTLWITYPNDQVANEDEFEARMWSEMSNLTSKEEREKEWAPGWSKDPADPNFTICIGGHAFFVVGLNPHSSRSARQFPYPAIVMNVFDQFEDLTEQGAYESMVAKNREREMKFSGNLNRMVVEHGDKWESIQFSGKENRSDWKCPFHFKESAKT